jgi:hypothetical protein
MVLGYSQYYFKNKPRREKMSKLSDPLVYQISLLLANQSHLEMILFSHRHQRWIMTYNYRQYPEGQTHGQPDLVNEIKLVVEYLDGVVASVGLSMHVIFPNRLGQVYAYGADISPGAKTFLQFHYEKAVLTESSHFFFRLIGLEIGCGKKFDLRPSTTGQAGGLIKPVNFPFPVLDRIEKDCGQFKIPFLDNNQEIRHFEFPCTILMPSH